MRLTTTLTFLGALAVATAYGEVALLTDETFDDAVNKGYTFVKFFAPWCGHCQTLEPTWERLSHEVQGVKVVRVDCTQSSPPTACEKVRGFPTLTLFHDGVAFPDYRGDRKLPQLKEYVHRATSEPVKAITSVAQLEQIRAAAEKTHSVFFVHARVDSDSTSALADEPVKKKKGGKRVPPNVSLEFRKLARANFMGVDFYETNNKEVLAKLSVTVAAPNSNGVAVVACKDGRVVSFEPFGGAFAASQLSDWFALERWPLCPPLTPQNGQFLADSGKTLVMGVQSSADLGSELGLAMRQAATQVTEASATVLPEARDFQFVVANINDYSNFYRGEFGMTEDDVPTVVVWRSSSRENWPLPRDTAVTADAITAFVTDVVEGKIEASGGTGVMAALLRGMRNGVQPFLQMYRDHPYIGLGGLVVFLVFARFMWKLATTDDQNDPFAGETPTDPQLKKDQ